MKVKFGSQVCYTEKIFPIVCGEDQGHQGYWGKTLRTFLTLCLKFGQRIYFVVVVQTTRINK